MVWNMFYFPNIANNNNNPNWLVFLRGVETTNQIHIYNRIIHYIYIYIYIYLNRKWITMGLSMTMLYSLVSHRWFRWITTCSRFCHRVENSPRGGHQVGRPGVEKWHVSTKKLLWEPSNYVKTIGKPWENGDLTIVEPFSWGFPWMGIPQ